MNIRFLIPLLATGGLMLCSAGCSGSSEESSPAAPSAEVPGAEQPQASAHTSDPEPDRPDHAREPESAAPTKVPLCTTIGPSDLTAVTGIEYSTTNSTADFPTIKHCEYFADGAKYSVSLFIAFDTAARQRMEQNRQYPGIVAVDNLGDDAIWEPAQGTLTVLDGNRCAEVRLSTSHGDDETRRSLAAKLSALLFERY